MKTLLARNFKTLSLGLLLLASVLVGYGLWGLQDRYRATHRDADIPTEVVQHTTENPDEAVPTAECSSYKVASNQPRTITLPSLGVSGCIQKVGLDRRSAISAPTNIHLAGWYVHGAVPGESGVSLIDGHVQGRYSEGIFKNLHQLRQGDPIQVRMGDGQARDFVVVRSDVYGIDDAAQQMLKQMDGIDKQLTLITCGGTYDKQTKTYNKRVVVRAKLR